MKLHDLDLLRDNKKANGANVTRLLKPLLFFLLSGLIFSGLGGLAIYAYWSTRHVNEPWHLVSLDEEFRKSKLDAVADFDAYLRLEERLFQELRAKVYAPSTSSRFDFNRYRTGSRSDPLGFPVNWNKTFELPVANPQGGVLMLHGLTDSPYSVRSLAEKMHGQGFWVVGLRLPGHGTIPAELLDVHWQDWAAAVRIGARRVREQVGADVPVYIFGYSNGAALAVEYAISALEGEPVPRIKGLVLISPALRLQPTAILAKFQLGLTFLPGLGKLAWESIAPEYDPYKYNSFPVNAGEQTYRLALNVKERLEKMARNKRLSSFPKTLAFQSVVDTTVEAEGVMDDFLIHLPVQTNTLVLYDVNQLINDKGLLANDGGHVKARLAGKVLPFAVELVTNMTPNQNDLRVVLRKAQQTSTSWEQIPYAWPLGICSLSHVALPFPPDDPIYGTSPLGGSGRVRLGNINIKGEKNVFAIPEKNVLRLRYNPFYTQMENRVLRFMGLANDE